MRLFKLVNRGGVKCIRFEERASMDKRPVTNHWNGILHRNSYKRKNQKEKP
jgi:hypothetical protein